MSTFKSPRPVAAVLVLLGAILTLGAASASGSGTLVAYNVYPLVSDSSAVTAPLADASLLNGWGLSATATSPWWSANNKANNSTLYTGVGSKNATVVAVPGGPTGTVANASTTDFSVSAAGVSGASRFLFDTLGGQILGWTPTVNATNAVVAVDNSAGGAVYTGLATANDRLYAADFHKRARVDSFDASFKSASGSRSRIRTSPRAGRRSASRRWPGTSTSRTPNRTARRRRPSRAAATATSTSSRQTGRSSPGWPRRASRTRR